MKANVLAAVFLLAVVGASGEQGMIVVLKTPTGSVEIELTDTPAAKDLLLQLPADLQWSDYAGIEKIATLNKKLTAAGEPKAYAGRTGDLCYYAPWGNLALFLRDGGASEAPGLVLLGRIRTGTSLKVPTGEFAGRLGPL
jgi:hypothetical protein